MEDMKKAYKKKALIHHPDRNGGVQSDEFLRLKQAYDNLIDPAKRRNYDAFHHTGEFKKEGRPLSPRRHGLSTSRSGRGVLRRFTPLPCASCAIHARALPTASATVAA